MHAYAKGHGQWIDTAGIRVEVYHDGSWVVYTTAGGFRSMSSADGEKAADLEGAKEAARKAYEQLNRP